MNKILEVDCTTAQQTERDMNESELAQLKLDAAEAKAQAKTMADKATAKAALLEKLGISADEAALLLS